MQTIRHPIDPVNAGNEILIKKSRILTIIATALEDSKSLQAIHEYIATSPVDRCFVMQETEQWIWNCLNQDDFLAWDPQRLKELKASFPQCFKEKSDDFSYCAPTRYNDSTVVRMKMSKQGPRVINSMQGQKSAAMAMPTYEDLIAKVKTLQEFEHICLKIVREIPCCIAALVRPLAQRIQFLHDHQEMGFKFVAALISALPENTDVYDLIRVLIEQINELQEGAKPESCTTLLAIIRDLKNEAAQEFLLDLLTGGESDRQGLDVTL